MKSFWLATCIVSALLLASTLACGSSVPCTCDSGQPCACKGSPSANVLTRQAQPSVLINGELYGMTRQIPAMFISTPFLRLEGVGLQSDGTTIDLFSSTKAPVEEWELLSPTTSGEWGVWRPDAIARFENPPLSTLIEARRVTWPDSCLGVPLSGENCDALPRTGYTVVIQQTHRVVEYHVGVLNARVDYRIASYSSGGDTPKPTTQFETPASVPVP